VVTPPEGWTPLGRYYTNDFSNNQQVYPFVKVHSGSESDPTVTREATGLTMFAAKVDSWRADGTIDISSYTGYTGNVDGSSLSGAANINLAADDVALVMIVAERSTNYNQINFGATTGLTATGVTWAADVVADAGGQWSSIFIASGAHRVVSAGPSSGVPSSVWTTSPLNGGLNRLTGTWIRLREMVQAASMVHFIGSPL
jgi:hypothetical protein